MLYALNFMTTSDCTNMHNVERHYLFWHSLLNIYDNYFPSEIICIHLRLAYCPALILMAFANS